MEGDALTGTSDGNGRIRLVCPVRKERGVRLFGHVGGHFVGGLRRGRIRGRHSFSRPPHVARTMSIAGARHTLERVGLAVCVVAVGRPAHDVRFAAHSSNDVAKCIQRRQRFNDAD